MNELNVAVIQNQGSINFSNYEEICAQMQVQMQIYKELEFSEENKKEAKADIATLRKIRKAVDDKRKEIKKAYMKPYEDFENKVKTLLGIIDEPIALIDTRVKEFEAKRIAEKKEQIKSIFSEMFGEFLEIVSLESIYKPEWENATCAEKAIRYDMSEKKLQITNAISAIKQMNTNCTEDAIKTYVRSGYDLGAAMLYINQYESIKSKALENVKSEPVREVPKEESYVTGFATNNQIEALFAVICNSDDVPKILKLLADNGYQAERR